MSVYHRRLYKNFAKCIKMIHESGQTKEEVFRGLVKASDSDDVCFLLDVFEELVDNLKEI